MALWGQGDDRWIVNNLDDGKNVNSCSIGTKSKLHLNLKKI